MAKVITGINDWVWQRKNAQETADVAPTTRATRSTPAVRMTPPAVAGVVGENGKITRRPQMTTEDKIMILNMHKDGSSFRKIGKVLGRNHRVISAVCRRHQSLKTTERKQGNGRPRKHKNLLLTGAGTQEALVTDKFLFDDTAEGPREVFGVDAKLDALSGAFPGSFAHITLNSTWKFPSSYHFHGTMIENSISEDKRKYVDSALEWLNDRWKPSATPVNVHVTIIGVGLSSRNGTGLKELFAGLKKTFNIAGITIIDPEPVGRPQITWFKSNVADMDFEHVQENPEAYLEHKMNGGRKNWPVIGMTSLPTYKDIRVAFEESEEIANALSSTDRATVSLITNILRSNEWKLKETVHEAPQSGK